MDQRGIQPVDVDLEAEKLRLEIMKLQNDIKYAKRTFATQLANTIIVAIATASVLYLFQRPQLEQMRQSQLAGEKQQACLMKMSVFLRG